MRKIAVILLVSWSTITYSQVIRREAQLNNGEDQLELRDSVRVSASNFKGGEYDATVHLWVHDDYVNVLDKRLMAGAALLSVKKDTLGFCADGFPIDSLWESTARRMSKYHEVILSGKIIGRQLERRSFPTLTIEHFFEGKRGGAVRDALVEHLKTKGWEGKDFGEYECWAYLNRSANPSQPDFQTLIIFRSGIPYCLVNKGEEFEYAKLKGAEMRDYGMFYFFQRPNDRFLKEIDDIVFDYVVL